MSIIFRNLPETLSLRDLESMITSLGVDLEWLTLHSNLKKSATFIGESYGGDPNQTTTVEITAEIRCHTHDGARKLIKEFNKQTMKGNKLLVEWDCVNEDGWVPAEERLAYWASQTYYKIV
jgi:hypothetical protein